MCKFVSSEVVSFHNLFKVSQVQKPNCIISAKFLVVARMA